MHFLSTHLLKEQMMISVKKSLVVKQNNSPNDLLKFSYQIICFTEATLISTCSRCFCCWCYSIIFWKLLWNHCLFLVQNACQITANPIGFKQNLRRNFPCFTNHFSAKFALKISLNFLRNGPFFQRNLSLKIPRNLAFSTTYQKPWWVLWPYS